MSLLLIRATLRPGGALASLGPLLLPGEPGAHLAAAHRLIWSLFADDPDTKRDFLFREEAPGRYLVLGRRAPAEDHPFFATAFKPFAPALSHGDRLTFRLRANPTISVKSDPEASRGRRHDAIWHALRATEKPHRAASRAAVVQQAGLAWLARQGERTGFCIAPGAAWVENHDTIDVPRAGERPLRLAVADFAGTLEIADPARFTASLAAGFGRARAFGCGLMLIRRARG